MKYPEIAEPPLEDGAAQETLTCALPETPETPVGAPGTAAGITAAEATEATLLPTEFVAMTMKVYEVPLVRPVTVHVNAPAVAQCLLVS